MKSYFKSTSIHNITITAAEGIGKPIKKFGSEIEVILKRAKRTAPNITNNAGMLVPKRP